MQRDHCVSDLVGKRVRKAFPGFGLFEGTITSFNPIKGFYKVEYEDGDREDMELHEVQQFLVKDGPKADVALPAPSVDDPPSPSPTNNCVVDIDDASSLLPTNNCCTGAQSSIMPSNVFAPNSESDSLSMPSSESPSTGETASHLHWSVASLKKVPYLGAPLLLSGSSKSLQPNTGRGNKRPTDGLMPAAKSSLKVKRARVNAGCVPVAGMHQSLKAFELGSSGNSTASAVSCESNLQTEDTPCLPPLEHPPPSSKCFKVPHDAVLDFLETYCFLRSFSRVLFLSPFALESFEHGLISHRPTCLMDSVHLCLLQALRRNLEKLDQGGLTSARSCLRQVNWTLLDSITWPLHLMVFLATHGSGRIRRLNFALSRSEYYEISVHNKVAILNELCHHVMDTDEIRAEIASRESASVDNLNEVPNGLPHMADVFQQPKHSVGDYEKKMLEAAKKGVEGKNLDECILCGMNGHLLCCDSCPAAYHARCVGVSRVMLLQGDWLCPECVVDRPHKRQLNLLGLRGGNLLGVDPYGHTFIVAWGYLLIVESCAGPKLKYYDIKDFPAVLEWLDKMKPFSDPVKSKVLQHWSESHGLSISQQEFNHESTQTYKESSFRRGRTSERFAANEGGSTDGLRAPSLLSTVVGCNHHDFENSQLTSDCGFADSNKITKEGLHHPLVASALYSLRLVEARADDYSLQSSNKSESYQKCQPYFNYYSLGDAAATAVANLTIRIAKRRARISPSKEQLAAFSKSFVQFQWPSSDNRLMELSKEKCGWCFCCSSGMKRGCILNQAARILSAGAARVPSGVRLTSFGPGHLPVVAGYLLYMENSLKALLSGSWQDAGFRISWQKMVQRAEHVNDLKFPLLRFESCLRPALLSGKWFNSPEETFTCGTYLEDIARPVGACKKSQHATSTPTTGLDGAAASLFVQSWEKGKSSRNLFQRFILPSRIARQAGRQGGLREIQGLFYSEEHGLPMRSLRCAWQARVEASCSVSQLALQVRCLDAHLRWNDLYSDFISADARKPSNVYAKSWKNKSPIYLVDKDVLKQKKRKTSKPIPTNCQDRVWVVDTQMPLSLLRNFEETLWLRQQNINCHGTMSNDWLRNCKGFKKGLFLDCKSSSAVFNSEQSLVSIKSSGADAHKYDDTLSASSIVVPNCRINETPRTQTRCEGSM